MERNMGRIKNYLIELLQAGDNQLEQDAIEWAIYSNWIPITYRLDVDHKTIRDQLPQIVEAFRRVAAENEATQYDYSGS